MNSKPDPAAAANVVLAFGEFRIDLRRRLLSSAQGAQPVPLPSKAFETLAYLVQRREQVVEKADLMQAIWRNLVVEENNLNQVISVLRRALGERRGEHRFIVTVPGHGYRFVAEVHAEERASASRSMAKGGPPSAQTTPSIAVLPFANLTGDADKDYFGDGIAEELIHTLSRVPGLRVPARTSSFAYKGRNVDVREIARDLNVSRVLEGSVRSAGERIRITAQLVDGGSGFHVWSETFDRHLDDIFQLQDELAAAILRTVSREHDGMPLQPVVDARATRDVQAYQLYLQGSALAARRSLSNLTRAAELLGQAIARDPCFARAICAAAAAHVWLALYFNTGSLADALSQCEDYVRQALVLDPSLAEAEALLGLVEAHRLRWTQAEERYRRSFALGIDAQALIEHGFGISVATGHLEQGRRTLERALDLAPGQPAVAVQVAVLHSFEGRDAEALRLAALAEALGWPAQQLPLPIVRSQAARRAGHLTDAAEHMMQVVAEPAREAGIAELIRCVFRALGDSTQRATALGAVRALMEGRGEAALAAPALPMLLVHWAVMLGDLDLAFDISFRALDRFERGHAVPVHGFVPQLWLLEMRPFRHHPRFFELAQRLRLTEHWAEYGAPDGCELHEGRLVFA